MGRQRKKNDRYEKPPPPENSLFTVIESLKSIHQSLRDSSLRDSKADAKLQVLFIRVANLQVEVQKLCEKVERSNTLFLALLNDPQARLEIEAVARELRIKHFT